MKPQGLNTMIFLDSADPNETRGALQILGFLDGQTTNPSLLSKNSFVREKLEKRELFTSGQLHDYYKSVVQEISSLIPNGSVSIEVYSDADTDANTMIAEASEQFKWINNGHIKLPVTLQGLTAAEKLIKLEMRVNMTLCFSQMQAGAVYVATKTVVPQPQYLTGYKNVFVSPFIGRLDDKEVNGAELVKNIIQMYKGGDEHVSVLASSVRSLRHMLYALAVGADIVTAPLQVLREWAAKGMPVPQAITPSIQNPFDLRDIPYEEIDMNRSWDRFDISHELTDKGIDKFSSDWNNLIKNG